MAWEGNLAQHLDRAGGHDLDADAGGAEQTGVAQSGADIVLQAARVSPRWPRTCARPAMSGSFHRLAALMSETCIESRSPQCDQNFFVWASLMLSCSPILSVSQNF